jgi:prephenate dehydrogenase
MAKPKTRKAIRVVSDAYRDSIRPATIQPQHWDMWLQYNKGLTTTEIAMVHHTTIYDVMSIISDVVERLKRKEPTFDDDFVSVHQAEAFRNRIKQNVELAMLSGRRVVTIMSEV